MMLRKLKNSLFIRLSSQTFYVYRQRFPFFYLITIVPVAIGLVVNKYYIENDILVGNIIQSSSFEIFYIIDFFVNCFLAGTVIIYISAIIIYMHSCAGEKPYGFFSAYIAAISKSKSLFWVLILYAVRSLAWGLLLIIPGIFALINFSLAPLAVLVEGKKGNEALNASKMYVKRNLNQYLDPLFFMFILVSLYGFTALYFFENLKLFLYYNFSVNLFFSISCIEWFVVFNCVCFFLTFYYLLYQKIKEEG